MAELLTLIADDDTALRLVMFFGQHPGLTVRLAGLPRHTLCAPAEVAAALARLQIAEVVYHQDGAVWLNPQWQAAATYLAHTQPRTAVQQRLRRLRPDTYRETIRRWLYQDAER